MMIDEIAALAKAKEAVDQSTNQNQFQKDVSAVLIDEAGRQIMAIDEQLKHLQNEKRNIQEEVVKHIKKAIPDISRTTHAHGDDYVVTIKENEKISMDEKLFFERLEKARDDERLARLMSDCVLPQKRNVSKRGYEKAMQQLSSAQRREFLDGVFEVKPDRPTVKVQIFDNDTKYE